MPGMSMLLAYCDRALQIRAPISNDATLHHVCWLPKQDPTRLCPSRVLLQGISSMYIWHAVRDCTHD